MKKNLLFLIVSLFLAITANSQERTGNLNANSLDRTGMQAQTSVIGKPVTNIPPCFCCDPVAYNLPVPQIVGGNTPPLCSCDPIRFSTTPCPNATFIWSVVDNFGNTIAVSGGNTNAIALNYSLAQQLQTLATSLTVKLQVCCGKNCLNTTIQVALKPIPKTNVSFTLSDNGNGVYTATATALCGAAFPSGWTLKEINCPGPNPCGWVAGPIKWQTGGNTINIPNNTLVKGKCYVLTHYVNVCSSVYIAGPCTVYGVTCFSLDSKSLKMMANPNDKNDAMPLKQEMIQEMQQIR